jgi:hypothetical protein
LSFPAGIRSVLFFSRYGVGSYCYCYGTGAECNEPADNSKGTHAYPYRYQICIRWTPESRQITTEFKLYIRPHSQLGGAAPVLSLLELLLLR